MKHAMITVTFGKFHTEVLQIDSLSFVKFGSFPKFLDKSQKTPSSGEVTIQLLGGLPLFFGASAVHHPARILMLEF